MSWTRLYADMAPCQTYHNVVSSSSSSFSTREILAEVSGILDHGEDEEELMHILQPRPFCSDTNKNNKSGGGNKVIVVSQFSTLDDSNLCNSEFVGDVISLLSKSSASQHNKAEEGKEEERFYYINDAVISSSSGSEMMAADISKKRSKKECIDDDGGDVLLDLSLKNVVLGEEVARHYSHTNKKQKIDSPTFTTSNRRTMDESPSRNNQAEQWDLRFRELLSFKETFGHCNVPHKHEPNFKLAQWVKRQRYQFKLKLEGKHSTLTEERLEMLGKIGFVWDSHETSWNARYIELREFNLKHGHSNVPTNYRTNHQLSIWVKCQRRQYKLHVSGKTSTMTAERIAKLEKLGFDWNPRNLLF